MSKHLFILILEDNSLDAELVRRELIQAGLAFTAQVARNKAEFLAALDTLTPDLLLADYALPGFSGMDALALARQRFPDIPVIIVSGAIGEEVALEAIKAGATDYVLKQRLSRLGPVVKRAFEEARAIGDKKKAEAELKRSNEDLQQFAYVAAHDLQEPVRLMTSYAQLLQRRYKGKLDADADSFLEYISDSGQRMQTLIVDLLDYSRIGRAGARLEAVDCNAVLKRVLADMQAAIQDSGAEVTSGALPVLTGNTTNLARLFQNLVGNALKFHGDQPPRIHVNAQRKGAHWLFSVKDNGIGVAAESLDRIFVIFQRLHGRDKYSGTGIGLSICKKIVETCGGRIWLESEPGKGSTFFFTVPVKEEKKP